MSGQQIGSAVGFVAGFFLPGGPMVWSAIGGAIGGWISPTQVEGPKIGDSASQSSAEGQPIPWILGTCGWIEGNIVDKSEIRDVEKKDDGKGSGVETITHEAHQDFCIMICESSTVRNSLMVGVLIVQVDGKIVYDMRPDSDFGADNAKFLEHHTFYNGNDAQLPDPTMEALPHNGVGNTPYYRNVFTMVARDINLSQYGERIPVYRFVMVGSGEEVTTSVTSITGPVYGEFQNSSWPLASQQNQYSYRAFWVDGEGAVFQSEYLTSIADCNAWFEGETGIPAPTLYVGYAATTQENAGNTAGNNTSGNPVKSSLVAGQPDITDFARVVLLYQFQQAATINDVQPSAAMCSISDDWAMAWNGSVIKQMTFDEADALGLFVFGNCGSPQCVAGYYPYCISVSRAGEPPSTVPMGDPCLLGVPVQLPDAPGFMIDCAGLVSPLAEYEPIAGVYSALQAEVITGIGDFLYLQKKTIGPILETADPNNTEEFWESAYETAVIAGTMPEGLTWPADYPQQIYTAYQQTYSTTSLTDTPISVATAITRIAIRGGLTEDDIEVTEMDQDLLGYMITQNYIGTDCIRPLMTAFLSYASEYDAKIRFHKHGEDIDLIIDPQDIIQGTEESDKNTRDQQVEFPKTYSITYVDAEQDYTARPQVDRRTSSDVRAIGEMQTQVPVVLPADYARQLANIGMKVNWARAMGSREFSVPYAGYDVYLKLVSGKPLAMDAQRRIASEISLEDGEIQIKALYDRQSAYTSDIGATPAIPPTPPPSNVGGVTLFAALNIGVIRDQDDTLGLQIAVAGLLSSWPGASLQWKLDTDSDWTTAIASMTQASTMGYLTETLPLAPAEGDDVTNTLSVAVKGGELNSITRLQYLNEANPYAIISNETTGECEIGQFQTAVETAPGEYDLTILTRGGLSTTPAEHEAGARFVFLDSVYFLPVPIAWIGRTINLRPVTFGTVPDNNATYSILFQPAVSQIEWQPGLLTGRISGGAFIASVTPRHRLGNDMNPVASINFTGYRWTLDDGDPSHAQSFDTVEPSAVFDLSEFDSPATITVAELNRITGPGPTLSIIA